MITLINSFITEKEEGEDYDEFEKTVLNNISEKFGNTCQVIEHKYRFLIINRVFHMLDLKLEVDY